MVIPIADDNSRRRTTPGITYLLVAVNVLVFLAMVRATPTEQARLMATYAAVPQAAAQEPAGKPVKKPARPARPKKA